MNIKNKPGPNKKWEIKAKDINNKIATILGLLLLFSIGLGAVYTLTQERKNRHENVSQEVQSLYGYPETIYIPRFTSSDVLQEEISPYILQEEYPQHEISLDKLNIKVKSTHELKNRGIFQVPVYTADIELSGELNTPYNSINSTLFLENPSNIKEGATIQFNQNPPTKLTIKDSHLISNNNLINSQIKEFKINFQIIGTKELLFNLNRDTEQTNITIDSSWPYPSFQGGIGTTNSTIHENGFKSTWEISKNQLSSRHDTKVGYKLYEPNDIYKKTDRSIKYGIIVIALVFFSFMLVELLSGTPVNNIQYILIGMSLIVYYTLLLSLGEIIGFNQAYFIASLATILLNTIFSKSVLKENKYAYSISGLLSAIYFLIFLILQTTKYTLLIGSLSAYIITAISMYITYYINFQTNE